MKNMADMHMLNAFGQNAADAHKGKGIVSVQFMALFLAYVVFLGVFIAWEGKASSRAKIAGEIALREVTSSNNCFFLSFYALDGRRLSYSPYGFNSTEFNASKCSASTRFGEKISVELVDRNEAV